MASWSSIYDRITALGNNTVRELYIFTDQGLIQDFLLGGGNHIFEIFLDIFGQQNRRIQFSNSTIDQFKYSHFVCFASLSYTLILCMFFSV